MKLRETLLALAFLFLLLTSCSPENVEKDNSNLQEIKYTQMKFYDPVFVGKEKGFFEEQGVDVKFVGELYGGPEMIQAISSGSADAGSTAITALINSHTKDFKITGVTDVQTSFDTEPIHKWITLGRNNISEPSDWIGKKVAVNSLGASFHYTTIAYLEQHNISPDKVEFVTVPHPYMDQALRSGNVDIAGMVKPFTEHLLRSNETEVDVLFDTVDVFGNGTQVVVGIFSNQFIENNPESVSDYIKAYNKAIEFIQNNSQEARQIFSKRLGVDAQYINHQKYQEHAKVDMNSINTWIDLMENRGDIEEGSVNSGDISTNRLNPYVMNKDD